ncbi:SecDF P1 head subdomain-containing protein [Paenibacillus sinopodophylli]|uniref:SecDF P1 head subdomain-containing protein n=1 Tax=Paenibacillus sinopodophylli TaxID=1837342 RepID=UPI00110CE6E1|nr:hypothetical protein [Paenibacillus sinopodophylli]
MYRKRVLVIFAILLIMLEVSACANPAHKLEVLYEVEQLEGGTAITRELMLKMAKGMEFRLVGAGVSKPNIRLVDSNKIRLKLSDASNEEELREMLMEPFYITFRGPDGTIEMDSSDLKRNGASLMSNMEMEQSLVINLKDKNKLEAITTRLVGQYMTIYLGDMKLSEASINQPISDDDFQISGNYTPAEWYEFEDMINLGTLPFKLTEIPENR